jgi:hypothetical protein
MKSGLTVWAKKNPALAALSAAALIGGIYYLFFYEETPAAGSGGGSGGSGGGSGGSGGGSGGSGGGSGGSGGGSGGSGGSGSTGDPSSWAGELRAAGVGNFFTVNVFISDLEAIAARIPCGQMDAVADAFFTKYSMSLADELSNIGVFPFGKYSWADFKSKCKV